MELNEKGFIKIEEKKLIDWKEPNGEGCMASNKITKDGWKVGYMYREEPTSNNPDSGWRFFKGDEDEEYTSTPGNIHIFRLNTICNLDEDIIPYLNSKVGSAYVRVSDHEFALDDGTKEIYFVKQ